MNNFISPVSFKGNLFVTTWERGQYIYKDYKTTELQDKLLQTIARNITPADEVVTLSEKNAKIIHSILEYVAGAKIKNLKNEKALYHNGKDQVEYADHNAQMLGGVKVILDY